MYGSTKIGVLETKALTGISQTDKAQATGKLGKSNGDEPHSLHPDRLPRGTARHKVIISRGATTVNFLLARCVFFEHLIGKFRAPSRL